MSVCLESSNVLTSSVVTCNASSTTEDGSVSSTTVFQGNHDVPAQTEVTNAPPQVAKSTAKLVVTNHPPSASPGNPVFQKVVNPPLITVLNPSGPLTVVKTLCVTSGVSSTPQYTVVNSTPLTVTNSGKPATITLLNGPVTVVKAISATTHQVTEKTLQDSQSIINTSAPTHAPVPAIIENRTHNVFVKNTLETEMSQSHKLLTANNFPQNNLINITQPPCKVNGQRNKVKIVSNIIPNVSQGPNNLMLNKSTTSQQQRYVSRPKVIGPTSTASTTKYLNKPSPNSIPKPGMMKNEKSPQKMVYPTHKSQMKSLPPVNNYIHKPQGIKTLSPQPKPMPNQVQRTGSGLRTIPAQKPPKVANKPNYIGKHAVQAQKLKHPHGKLKTVKPTPSPYNSYHNMPMPDKQSVFNQALTAEILDTLGNKNGASCSSYSYKNFENMNNRYDNSYLYNNSPVNPEPPPKPVEEKKSGLDTLSLICQAVLLDHNYNATLPPESPTRPVTQTSPQLNGIPPGPLYSPGIKRRSLSSSNAMSATSSMSNLTALPSNSTLVAAQDDDAASDISYGSDRKHDTEGEETDTAPEAEAVNNNEDAFDHYGDYVTRCICGYLHDDGYMIECDRCKVWQHVQCVVKNKQVPEEYLCEVCEPTKLVDRHKAKLVQQQWLRDRQLLDLRKTKETKLKDILKHKDPMSDSDSSDQEPSDRNENLSKNELNSFSKTHCCVAECNNVKSKSISLFRFPLGKTLCQKWVKELQIGKKVNKHMLVCSLHFKETDFQPNTPFRLRKRLKANVVPSQNLPPRKLTVTKKRSDKGHNNNLPKARTTTMPNRRKSDIQQKQVPKQRRELKDGNPRKQVKRRERKVIKRKTKVPTRSHSDDENQEAFNSAHLPQLRQWIENYEEAVTNHYSPELRARISSIRVNGTHSDIAVQFDPLVNKCRVHTQPLTEVKYLVSTVHLSPNTSVVELRGKYMLSTQHRNSGGALTTRQHAQRPGPFLFFYRLHKDNTEVCVDTRTYGNNARFIRRSCKPNAELRHCIEKGVLHLYIVTITTVDKNQELTIKHESHDLAAIGTTHISCACGYPEECTVNKTTVKKNGDNTAEVHRKRRGRRTTSFSAPVPVEPPELIPDLKEEPVKEVHVTDVVAPPPSPPPPPPSPPAVIPLPQTPIIIKEEPIDTPKEELKPVELKEEIKEEKVNVEPEQDISDIKQEQVELENKLKNEEEEDEVSAREEDPKAPQAPVSTRRSSSHHKSDWEDSKEHELKEVTGKGNKNKKLSREERKLEAILRAIEQMEKADQRKQEHQAKQAHRRESEPGPNVKDKDEDKSEPKAKRRRRKGRTKSSSNSNSNRRTRINSTDSYLTSGDESLLLSPVDQPHSSLKDDDKSDSKDTELILSLPNRENGQKEAKSPVREDSNNSNSAHSSPETHLSSACLLVQAAVEPLEPGFKFPKTKKGLMNEWLNKVPEPIHSASSISPSSLTPHINASNEYESNSNFYPANKTMNALTQAASYCEASSVQQRGNAKKRWLRQAISEDQCDSPLGSRPESPPVTEIHAPPKKRRLPRESLSSEASPVTTPTGNPLLSSKLESEKTEGCVEIVFSGTGGDSPTQALESDAILKERAAEMKQEFSSCLHMSVQEQAQQQLSALSCIMDPRLRDQNHQMFSDSDHLVGTVEKTLSILGFEERKPEAITPAKRKLSITEYRQRKKLNNNDCPDKIAEEPISTEENNSSESFKPIRTRSNSSSSSTSITSSDDDNTLLEITGKASAFNSEPTELERQREISRFRLKKAFGLSLDDEPYKSTLDVQSFLNCELPPVVKPSIPLSSPTFPIPGSLIPGSINSASPKSLFSENSSSSHQSPVKSSVVEAERVPEPPNSNVIDESKETDLKPPTSPISDGEMSPLITSNDDEDNNVDPIPAVVEDDKDTCKDVPQKTPSECGEQKMSENKQPEELENSDKAIQDDGVEPNMFYTPDEEEVPLESTDVLSYVPPFNNPVYPTIGFSDFTSDIDNDARYEGRNPSPPPEMEPVVNLQKHPT